MLIAQLVFSGCSEEDENPFVPAPGPNLPDSSLPFPDTPDQLMANFKTIYETMDADEYNLILDPAFVTLLQQGTIDDFPQVGEDLDDAEEVRIHDRMFLGEVLHDADGNLVPPVMNFSFNSFRQVVDWGLSLPTDPVPNTLSSLYEVEIHADRGQTFSTLKVERGRSAFMRPPRKLF